MVLLYAFTYYGFHFQFSKHHADRLAISKEAFRELVVSGDKETMQYLRDVAQSKGKILLVHTILY